MHAIKDNKFIGQRMRQLREHVGLSQSEVGALLGVSYQQVQKYERGMNRISVENLQRLAQVLMVPMTAFFEDIPPSAFAQHQVEEAPLSYQQASLSSRERDLLQWFRTLQDEETQACFAMLIKLVAQRQHQG